MMSVAFAQVRDNSGWNDSWVVGMADCAQLKRELQEPYNKEVRDGLGARSEGEDK